MKTQYGLLATYGGDIDEEVFRERVSVNAFYRAEKRGFEPGHDRHDWHEAELEITHIYRIVRHKTAPQTTIGRLSAPK